MKVIDVFLLIIMLGAIAIGVYVIWQILPGEMQQYKPIDFEKTYVPVETSKYQFYPNLRYQDKRISYKIENQCTASQELNALDAFRILEEKTILEFYESSNPQIRILCSEIAPDPEEAGHFVAGEGGPTKIVNTSLYYVIFSGKVSLFREEKCSTPQIALHEILHALGFDHNNNKGSIMYPVTSCSQDFDSYIINEINRLYSIPSYADLGIETIKAEKSGIYLNFHIEISNYGFRDADSVYMNIYTDGNLIKKFDLEDIPVGTKKFLDAENIRVPRTSNEITFLVATSSGQNELTLENNEVRLTPEET